MDSIIQQGSYANVLRLECSNLGNCSNHVRWGTIIISIFNEKMKQREIKEMSPDYTVRKW